jgi:hypothetical protein
MFVGIAGSMGRMVRANDDAAYDELRSVDAVTGDGGMRRNTPGAREERTDARGRAARMAHNNQQTMVVEGGGRRRRRYGIWTSASASATTRQHNTTRHDRNTPGAREERTGGDEEEEGWEGRDGTIDAECGTSDDDER